MKDFHVSFIEILQKCFNFFLFSDMTLCKYEVFILQDPQTHWVQCTLPVNVYLRKLYVIIYSWLLFLFFLLIVNIIYNLSFLVSGKKFLVEQIHEEKLDQSTVSRLKDNMGSDGLIILKLLKSNTNRYYSSNIITGLYQNQLKNN